MKLEPIEPAVTPGDRHPWRAALAIGALVVAGEMAFSLLKGTFTGQRGWDLPGDFLVSFHAAHYVANGALAFVYEATPRMYALPLFSIVLAPLAALAEWLHLSEQFPVPVPFPTMWLISGPLAFATGIPFLYSIRRFADHVRATGRNLPTQLAAVPLVILPIAQPFGHFEDLLALTFVLLSLRLLLRERPVAGALLLCLAIGFKQWAVLVLPIYLVFAPKGFRLRTALVALALPAILGGFLLLMDWEHAAPALLSGRNFPQFGHLAPWIQITEAQRAYRGEDAITVATGPYRAGAVGIAVAAALLAGRSRNPRNLIAGTAVALVARPLLEPVIHAYYLAPALGLLLLYERVAWGSWWRTLVVGGPLLLFFVAPQNDLWWPVYTAGIIVLAFPPIRFLARAPLHPPGLTG